MMLTHMRNEGKAKSPRCADLRRGVHQPLGRAGAQVRVDGLRGGVFDRDRLDYLHERRHQSTGFLRGRLDELDRGGAHLDGLGY